MHAQIIILFLLVPVNLAAAQEFNISTNSILYSDGQPLFVYGTGIPGENLILRLFAPDGTITKFDQITTNTNDGSFNHVLLIWPEPSTTIPYGTYTIEAISAQQNGLSKTLDIQFIANTDLVSVPIERNIDTLVFVPETAGIKTTLRVFVQITSDGLLIGGESQDLLRTTHVHLPSGTVDNISAQFQTLHKGLYYTDYIPEQLGTYVFHIVTFHQGTVSHGSAATNVQSHDIGGISKQILQLNTILDETSKELDTLKSKVSEFDSTLQNANQNIDSNVGTMSLSVSNIEEASVQLNSLLFPVVASIGIIVALQIAILARRR